EEQFTFNVQQTLFSVTKQIKDREIEDFYNVYSKYVDSLEVPENVNFSELVYKTKNDRTNEIFVYSDGILEEDYKLSSSFLDMDFDSIQFKRLTNRKKTTRINPGVDGENPSESN
ncbi:MAG TPA: two-component sensor histidine kinase, partial [Flavobacteriaceae bacterium]|nr:two-component sensor histidine kinase [Flavobacteriaceae bacterium]